MPRTYVGSYVRHLYKCDFCGTEKSHDYSAIDYDVENYQPPSKEPAPSGWVTGKIGNAVYYFDSPEHKTAFIDKYTNEIKEKF